MPWPTDAAYEAALEALFVLKETHGPEKLTSFLTQELGREAVIQRIQAARKMQAGEAMAASQPARSSFTEDDEVAVFAALEFYAREDNWQRQGGKPSAVVRDRGQRARQTLERLEEGGRE